jgi:hypothetical protein
MTKIWRFECAMTKIGGVGALLWTIGISDLLHPSPLSNPAQDLFIIGLAAVYLGRARFGLGKTDEIRDADEDEDI